MGTSERTIHKQTLNFLDREEIQIPRGAEILCVKFQRGINCIWYLLDPKVEETEIKIIYMIGTGHPIQDISKLGMYIGTDMFMDDKLVFHFFEGVK